MDDELVPYVHFMPVPTTATVNGRTYEFEYRNHVALAMVRKDDAPAIGGIMKECCGGRRRPIFQPASAAQVRIWNGMER